jgi:hypothetical protein
MPSNPTPPPTNAELLKVLELEAKARGPKWVAFANHEPADGGVDLDSQWSVDVYANNDANPVVADSFRFGAEAQLVAALRNLAAPLIREVLELRKKLEEAEATVGKLKAGADAMRAVVQLHADENHASAAEAGAIGEPSTNVSAEFHDALAKVFDLLLAEMDSAALSASQPAASSASTEPDKRPVTADGVRVSPGMKVYIAWYDRGVEEVTVTSIGDGESTYPIHWDESEPNCADHVSRHEMDIVFSTREAALASAASSASEGSSAVISPRSEG